MELRYRIVEATMSLDTAIYAAGDVLADTQEITNFFRVKNVASLLKSVAVIDEDDQGAAFDIYFFDANVSLGTENAAPNISDANGRSFLGLVSIATGDYKDVGGVRHANIKNIDEILKGPLDSTSVFVGIVNGAGTPTYSAAGIKLRFGVFD